MKVLIFYMGVSHYFRWLVSKLEADILSLESPGVPDYLYLDLNCAIHPVVKANPLYTRHQMYDAVLHYIEGLVKRASPSKMVYIAIDGTAPLAKMRQQRVRRFKTVYDAQCLERLRTKYNVSVVSSGEDFNMISPATEFMTELSRRIRGQIPVWKRQFGISFFFSDSLEPGEGEHKIMDHIREKTRGTDRIMVYGLDSDLIFLCLGNYRPGMSLLREVIHFGKGFRVSSCEQRETEFCYLSIDGLRGALLKIMRPFVSIPEMENFGIFRRFRLLKDEDFLDLPALVQSGFCSGEESDQRLIDDYIYICFMLGNDFLPHLPSLKIGEGGLDALLQIYKLVQHQRKDFIVDRSPLTVNVSFLRDLLGKLSEIEGETLRNATIQRERRIRDFYKSRREYLQAEDEYQKALVIRDNVELNEEDTIRPGFKGWKRKYYEQHFRLDGNDSSYYPAIKRLCRDYLEGMQWTLKYYLEGLPNWGWSYRHHAPPTVSDLHKNLCDVNKFQFERDQPCTPMAQLMYILPPQSAHLLPGCLSWYMNSDLSPLAPSYPKEITLDCIGKKMLWECHPLLPDISLEEIERIVSQNTYRFSAPEKSRMTRVQTIRPFVIKKIIPAK